MSKANPSKRVRAPARILLQRKGSARVIEETAAPAVVGTSDPGLNERPNGWYWSAPDGHQEFGPFETRELARADRDRFDEQGVDRTETVQEAEREVGMADWIDAETGEPAEGQSPPHLQED